jgi:hypothetical protein
MYVLETNYCNCHPATCNCDPWIIKENGRNFVRVYDKENGKLIIKALNEMEQRKKKR